MTARKPRDCRIGSEDMIQLFNLGSRTTLWRKVQAGILPPPTKLPGEEKMKSVHSGWWLSDVSEHVGREL